MVEPGRRRRPNRPRPDPEPRPHAQTGRFAAPATVIGDLDAVAAASLIAAAADITLVMEPDGILRDLSIRNAELLDDLKAGQGWTGRRLTDLVAIDSRPKAEALLADAARSEPKWRHLNHVVTDGRSVPVTYTCVQSGPDGRLVAFGRDLRTLSALQQRLMDTQHSLEQDYARLREAEMRYRLLFQTSAEAVLILDPARGRVTEANPAALTLFGVEARDIIGSPLAARLAPAAQAAAGAYLTQIRNGDTPPDHTTTLANAAGPVLLRATVFRQDSATMLLVRLSSADNAASTTGPANGMKAAMLRAVETSPDAFVVVDQDARVLTANAAFVEMTRIGGEDAARGQPLDRWVGESGVDVQVLLTNVRQRGMVRFFATTLRPGNGGGVEVELSAVSMNEGGAPAYGLSIRAAGPRLRTDTRAPRAMPHSVDQLTELVGRVPLKDLVREATEVIERMAIEAALELTNDNRASAAEMLGLSRQSLYVKLHRYGLGDLETAGEM